MIISNQSCCDHGKGEVIEFVGPVKIVLINYPSFTYWRRICGAVFIVIAQMMMGAIAMTSFFFAFSENKFAIALHIILCTVGYQLCVPAGILSLNKQNGFSAPLSILHRRYVHLFLQTFGVTLAVVASIILIVTISSLTLHGCFGIVVIVFSILTVISGFLLYGVFMRSSFVEQYQKLSMAMNILHRLLGIITVIAISVCFILGIWGSSFEKWVSVPLMIWFLTIFCVFYTVIVLYRPMINILKMPD